MSNKKRALILILILFAAILFRIPFLKAPLDRDSGEFSLRGYFWGQGYMLYKDLGSSRPPGLDFLLLILFKIFPPADITVTLFVAFWTLLNTALVYLLARSLFKNFSVSCLAAILYGFFSTSPFIEGMCAMTENFMITFNMLGFYFLLKAQEKKKLWVMLISGLSFGMGFIFKPVAGYDYAAALLYILIIFVAFREYKFAAFVKNTAFYIIVFTLPFLLTLVYFYYKGALDDYIFQAFLFNFKYIAIGHRKVNFWYNFFYANSYIFKIISIIYVGSLCFTVWMLVNLFSKRYFDKEFLRENKQKLLLILWGVFALLGLSTSGRFFSHYYIAVLPSFILMSVFILVYFFTNARRVAEKILIIAFLFLSLLASGYFHYKYYLKYNPNQLSMHQYGREPFVEAKSIGLSIKQNTKADDVIFIWAEEPEIHFYSLRASPCKFWSDTAFLYYDKIYENAEDIVFSSFKKKQPAYIVADSRHMGLLNRYQRIGNYLMENYVLEAEYRVFRNNISTFSLLVYKLK